MNHPRYVAALLGVISLGCAAAEETSSGSLEIRIQTVGTALDPDGYQLSVEGAQALAVATQDTALVEGLSVGPHLLGLTGLASHCVGPSSDTVDVVADTIVEVTLTVTCTATTGTLAVKLVTTGVALDPDGYSVAIDGGAPVAVGVNGTTTAISVSVGDHQVVLSDVVMNCTSGVPGPVAVSIEPAESDTLAWDVECTWPRIVAKVSTANSGIVLVNPDGSNEQVLYSDVAGEEHHDPAWSPDRQKLAFDRLPPAGPSPGRRIGVADPDSAPAATLLTDDFFGTMPRWHPSGASLLFIRPDTVAGPWRVYTRSLTPGSSARVSPDSLWAYQADWSPDGSQIAFVARDTFNIHRLYVMAANGSGVARISPDTLTQVTSVRWSPAGDRLILVNAQDFWTVGPTGAAPAKIVIAEHTASGPPTWSPDGSSLLLGMVNTTTGGYDVYRTTPTGTILGTMNRSVGGWFELDWR